jgi:hypothetical protein
MIRGSCLCGGVRFEILGKPGRSSHCHCSMCRKAHGAAFGTYAAVRNEDFKLLSGAALIARYPSSPGVVRTFCSRCGSTLQFISDKRPDIVDVALGVLDDDPGIRVPHHIFVASKAPWTEIADGLPQYPESAAKKSA